MIVAVFTSQRKVFEIWKCEIADSSHIDFIHIYEEQQLRGLDIDAYIELYPFDAGRQMKAIAKHLINRS